MRVLLVVGLLVLFSLSNSYGEFLVLKPSVSQEKVNKWISNGLDVRGIYGENPSFVLLVVNRTALSGYLEVLENDKIYIVETKVPQLLDIYERKQCIGGTCVVILNDEVADSQIGLMSSDVEIVLAPSHPIVTPATFPFGHVAAPDPRIADLITKVSEQTQKDFLEKLTAINTRQSQSTTAVEAANLLASTFTSYGFNTTTFPYRAGYASNVIAELRGIVNASKIVIIGAHYDCRADSVSSPTARAPGANDDGSGVSALVEIARIIGLEKITNKYTLRLIAFSGEEQGLYGSTAYADAVKANKSDIVAMLQGDMIAYQSGANPRLEFASRYATLSLNSYLKEITATYLPGLAVGDTTSCCSDQQPFYSNGYAAAAFNEGGGYTIDPQYHKVGDVVNRQGYSLLQLKQITQSILASALSLAIIN